MNGRLAIALLTLGIVVSATVVPGIFSVDENNYLVNVLALRQGHVTVTDTSGLTPSRELLFFDPTPYSRDVKSTPVASTAPPLYALMALPFSFFGWRGLVALNTLAYLATTLMVFAYARRYSTEDLTPWVAAAAFALGGYTFEYAQGLWPQSLSLALCTGGIFAAGELIASGSFRLAPLAGFVLALATGVRYQNAVVLAAVGAGIWFWASRRWLAAAAYSLAALPPLALMSAMNHTRLGSWNPVSKGPGYLRVTVAQDSISSWTDPLVMFWARVVDYSARPLQTSTGFQGWFTRDAVTGAYMIVSYTVKKALLQSAPWAVIGLMILLLAWIPSCRLPAARRRQLQLMCTVSASILFVFAFAGAGRDDGFGFNQRYLLELVPLLAIAAAWALDELSLSPRLLWAGTVLGAVAVLVVLLGTPRVAEPGALLRVVRLLAILKVPLLLAVALGVLWALARRGASFRPALAIAAGAAFGWGLLLHLGDDVATARAVRTVQLTRTGIIGSALTNGSALVAYWGNRDAAGPLRMDRDLIILDARADEGADAPVLIRELLGKGRRVVLLDMGLPPQVRARVLDGLLTTEVRGGEMPMLELRAVVPTGLPH